MKLSFITKEKLIDDVKNIKNLNKIASKYNISLSSVYYNLNKYNINFKKNRNLSKILTKKILEQKYNELGSLKAVARYFKVHASSIKKYMNDFNLKFSPQIRYSFNEDFFSQENEYSYYWAGFLAADGCVKDRKSKNGNRIYEIELALANKDLNHLEKFKLALKSNNKIHYMKNKNANSIVLVSKKLTNDLEKFNIVPRKTFIYNIPDFVSNSTLFRHFIRGYIDGDGSYYISNKKITYYIDIKGTFNTLNSIKIYLDSIVSKKNSNKIRQVKNIFSLSYGGNICVKEIINHLYNDANIYLDRKYSE